LPVPGGAPAHPALAVDAGLNFIGGPAGAGHGPGGGAGGRALRKVPGRARGLAGGGQLVRERRGGAQAADMARSSRASVSASASAA
jgi:hypothetical protein